MGKKNSKKGAGRGSRRRAKSGGEHGGETAGNRDGTGATPQAPSRLLLTRLLHNGAIWEVYVTTGGPGGAPNVTQLEFQGAGPQQEKVRYSRTLEGPLLDALHSGAPISRAGLADELELAVRRASADGGAG